MKRTLALTVCLILPAGLWAQSAPPALNAKVAQAIVEGCAVHATGKKHSHAIAVVDAGGHLVSLLRMDGNGYGIMDFAVQKAGAAAAWGFPTAAMADGAKSTPGFAHAPHVVTVAGGVPVYDSAGRTRIGAVGVSGEAPADDEACAVAGVTAAGLRTTRTASN